MLATIVSSVLRESPSLRRLSIRPATWPAGAQAPAWGSILARSFDGNRRSFCSGSGGGKSDGSSKNGNSKEPSDSDSASSTEEASISEKAVPSKSSEGSSGGKGEGGGSKSEGKGEKESGSGGGGRRKPSLFQRILKGSGGDKSNKASTEATEATVVKEAKDAKEGKDGREAKESKEDQEGAEESVQSGAIVPAGPRPENFPKVLALPLTRRPLFPGFYAPIHIKDPKLADSLVELRARGTPYVGAFLLKDAKESVVVESENAGEKSETAGEKSKEKTGEKSGEEVKDSDLKGEALYKRLHEYGTFAQVLNVIRSVNSDGPAQVFLMGHRRLGGTHCVTPICPGPGDFFGVEPTKLWHCCSHVK